MLLRRVHVVVPAAALALLALLAAAVLVSATVRHQITMSFVRQPDHFTELYFTEPEQLEDQGQFGGPAIDFTIANHEGHPHVYPYVVTLVAENLRLVTAHGQVRVPDTDEVRQRVVLGTSRPTTRYTVIVSLVGRAERIHCAIDPANLNGVSS